MIDKRLRYIVEVDFMQFGFIPAKERSADTDPDEERRGRGDGLPCIRRH